MPTTKQAGTKPLTNRERLGELKAFVNICLSILDEECEGDIKEICNRTGLCASTIYRLNNNIFTTAMQVRTVQKLGGACGLKLTLTEYEARVSVVNK